ncbi:unnamed protein product [Caenorhabditis sp. 36 PRJEB53466]|nr:unnamed protein product [Caenorhabditis sp. 36 PRJEB53466]
MVGASLLQSDDDSDVPDLDLRGSNSRRRNFFNKSGGGDYEEIRHRRKTYKTIFLFTVARIRVLSDEIKGLHQSLENVQEIQLELRRVRMQFEVIREGEMERSENGTRGSTTEMIYDKLANISGRFDVLSDGFQKNSMSMEDVTSRMSRVENKCLAVCQQHEPMDSSLERSAEK